MNLWFTNLPQRLKIFILDIFVGPKEGELKSADGAW